MRAVLVQNMREKYEAYMLHYRNMWRKWRVFTLDKMRRNAEK